MARTIVENGKTIRLTGTTERQYGIELELFATRSNPSDAAAIVTALTAVGIDCRNETYNHTARTWWKLVPDMSVETPNGRKGIELVSPPLSGEAGLRDIEKVCRALANLGSWVSRSCGMHVHHDAAGLTIDNMKDLALLMNRFALVFDGLVPESRRAGQARYSEHWTTEHLRELASVRSLGDLRTRFYGDSQARYRTLNLCSFQRHGTVEFRQHAGTIEADKIVSWVLLTQGLVEKAASGTVRVKKAQVKATGDGLDNLIRAAGLRSCRPHGQLVAPENKERATACARFITERARHFGVIALKDRSIERSRAKRAAQVSAASPETLVAQAVEQAAQPTPRA